MGYTKEPIGIQAYSHRCIPPAGASGADLASLPMGSQQRQVGLYLAKLELRVFDFDLVADNYLWSARGVPP